MDRNEEKKKELFEQFFSPDKKEGVDAYMDLMDIYAGEIKAKKAEIQAKKAKVQKKVEDDKKPKRYYLQ